MISEEEIKRLQRIEELLKNIFIEADKIGWHLGIGFDPNIPKDNRDGPIVKELRKLTGMDKQ